MNRIQGEALRAVVFHSYDGTRSMSQEDETAALGWLARRGYIESADWKSGVTPEGYVAGIREGLLTPWYRLEVNGGGIAMELNTYGRGGQNSTYEAREAFDAELRRGLAAGSYRFVEGDSRGYYRVEAR